MQTSSAAGIFSDKDQVNFCLIQVSNVPPQSSRGGRLKLSLVYVLQSCGDGPHVHLNTAGPVLHIPNFLFQTETESGSPQQASTNLTQDHG